MSKKNRFRDTLKRFVIKPKQKEVKSNTQQSLVTINGNIPQTNVGDNTQQTIPLDKVDKVNDAFSHLKEAKLPNGPFLMFTTRTWAKLHWMAHKAKGEVGGFGVCDREPNGKNSRHLLTVTNFALVKQRASTAFVKFTDEGVSDFTFDMDDKGLKPEQYGRVWIHTHPGNCAEPSGTDWATFRDAFGSADWAVMFIIARNGQTEARLAFNKGPKAVIDLDVFVESTTAYVPTQEDISSWEHEFSTLVDETNDVTTITDDKQAIKDAKDEEATLKV